MGVKIESVEKNKLDYYIENVEGGMSISSHKGIGSGPIIGVYGSVELAVKGLVRKGGKPGIVHYDYQGNHIEIDLSDKRTNLGTIYSYELKKKEQVSRTEELLKIERIKKRSIAKNRKKRKKKSNGNIKVNNKRKVPTNHKEKTKSNLKRTKPRHSYSYGNGHYTHDQIDKMNMTNTDSLSELKVFEYLKFLNIKFLNQDSGNLKCYNPKTGKLMPYDFELPDYNILIEVQGNQHYHTSKSFNRGIKELREQQYRDSVKRNFAYVNGYTEIEIPYKEIKSGKFKEVIKNILNN